MKKVLSIFAAAVVCAVMLVSCGAKSNFQKELEAIATAVQAKDYPTVVSNATTILNNIDKAAAGDLVSAGLAFSGVVNQKQQDGAIDPQEAIDLYTNAQKCLEAAKTKSDYAATVEVYKAQGNDPDAFLASIPNAVASFQAVIDAQTQQAEAATEEAEGEAEEGAEDAE